MVISLCEEENPKWTSWCVWVVGQWCLGCRENTYVEWVVNNILEEDGRRVEDFRRAFQEAGIDVDGATNQFRRSSSSESGQRQLNSCGPISDDDSTCNGDDNDDDGSSDDGWEIGASKRIEESNCSVSPFTGEVHFTHAIQDQHHGSPPRMEYLSYSRRKKHNTGSSSRRRREHDLVSEFSSIDVSARMDIITSIDIYMVMHMDHHTMATLASHVDHMVMDHMLPIDIFWSTYSTY